MHTLLIVTVALLVGTLPAGAAAQQTDSLLPGARVRLTASAAGLPRRYTGTLLAITADSLTVGGANPRTASVSMRSIEKLELSLGKSRGLSARKGLKRGLIIGGIAGVLLGVQSANAPPCRLGSNGGLCRAEGVSATTMIVGNTLFWGVGGGVYGVTIGAFFKSDRWKEMPLRPKL